VNRVALAVGQPIFLKAKKLHNKLRRVVFALLYFFMRIMVNDNWIKLELFFYNSSTDNKKPANIK